MPSTRCPSSPAAPSGRSPRAELGLFREQGVSTPAVMTLERAGSLTLALTTSRGAPAVQHVASKRKARSLVVPHTPVARAADQPPRGARGHHPVR